MVDIILELRFRKNNKIADQINLDDLFNLDEDDLKEKYGDAVFVHNVSIDDNKPVIVDREFKASDVVYALDTAFNKNSDDLVCAYIEAYGIDDLINNYHTLIDYTLFTCDLDDIGRHFMFMVNCVEIPRYLENYIDFESYALDELESYNAEKTSHGYLMSWC